MKDKQKILTDLRQGLINGTITQDDIKQFIYVKPIETETLSSSETVEIQEQDHDRLTAVDIMFYIAGFILFSAIMVAIAQVWGDTNSVYQRILLSSGVGIGLWFIAYYLIKSPIKSDVRNGLTNSLLLTGSLTMAVGVYIIISELVGGSSYYFFAVLALASASSGLLHIGFDFVIKRNQTLLLGLLFSVLSILFLAFQPLYDSQASVDLYTVSILVASGLLILSTRLVTKIKPERLKIRSAFDSLAGFTALASMYAATYGDLEILWYIALIVGILGIFYLSIVQQNRKLLGSASFFLIVTVVTISFKYFSEYGVSISLMIAAMGVLASAVVATSINKKYFKKQSSL